MSLIRYMKKEKKKRKDSWSFKAFLTRENVFQVLLRGISTKQGLACEVDLHYADSESLTVCTSVDFAKLALRIIGLVLDVL